MMTDNKIITIIMITTTPPTTPPAATGTILTAVLPVLSINTMKITIVNCDFQFQNINVPIIDTEDETVVEGYMRIIMKK